MRKRSTVDTRFLAGEEETTLTTTVFVFVAVVAFSTFNVTEVVVFEEVDANTCFCGCEGF